MKKMTCLSDGGARPQSGNSSGWSVRRRTSREKRRGSRGAGTEDLIDVVDVETTIGKVGPTDAKAIGIGLPFHDAIDR
jgi:hypothetical protein